MAADLSCSATLDGKEIFSGKSEVIDHAAEVQLGTFNDVELLGRAYLGQVSALMFFDGVMFGSISMNAASYTMLILGEGELSLFCRLDESFMRDTDFYRFKGQ